ncbi:hypothetical protein [Sphingosinithalassobacter portus]|uniref:hypothetical protein n=1 Tax=Stakelama portus TaxID=2676234 RepID=UPI000D6E7553|nr:hypothetical protein [Sphingosinithalassobacter portus]
MTAIFRSAILFVSLLLAGCDGYLYKGMDGRECLAKANEMSLPDAYAFYVQTYLGVAPPMEDVAETFKRFGPAGEKFLLKKALGATDQGEFAAVLRALWILDIPCSTQEYYALRAKAEKLDQSKWDRIPPCWSVGRR